MRQFSMLVLFLLAVALFRGWFSYSVNAEKIRHDVPWFEGPKDFSDKKFSGDLRKLFPIPPEPGVGIDVNGNRTTVKPDELPTVDPGPI
jgi:hypothetical protein